nr:mechanosensitive ion channel family protein [Oceanococcus sp. HetDA_MAG_MS8]
MDLNTLNTSVWNNTLAVWLSAGGITISAFLVVSIVRRFIIGRLRRLATGSSRTLNRGLAAVVGRTHQALLTLPALYLGTRMLELPQGFNQLLGGASAISLFAQVGVWGTAGLSFWISESRAEAASNNEPTTHFSAIGFVGRVVLWAVVLLLALDNLGVDITALVAGLGVGGIAVALAVQNILGDLFASLSIVIDKPFEVGDFIVVDTFYGTVENVGLKTTRVRSLGGEQLVFANSDLLGARVRNYKRMRERRILFKFGVLYQTPPDLLEQIPVMVREIIEAIPDIRFDRAHFFAFGESSYDFEVVYWMQTPEYNLYMDTQQSINLALVRRFAEAGIDFAYPTRTLFVEKMPGSDSPES